MSNKITNDKYYTPSDVVDFCLNEVKKIMMEDGITPSLVIEPSAGNGAFSSKIKNCVAYDIEPEAEGIIKQDFLELEQEYVKDSLIIGNPPFGRCLSLAQKFFKKSIQVSDYVAFILPISQLNNNRTFYEFDLVKSIDLGKNILYTDRKLHCCFNIYRRPKNNILNNPMKKNNLKTVKIIRQDSKNYENELFDVRMGYWGIGCAGVILNKNPSKRLSGEYKLQIEEPFKEKVLEVLKEVDWSKRLNCVSMLKIQQFHIIDLLKEKIPNIY